MDRFSRSVGDVSSLLAWFSEAERTLVALDLGVDTTTPGGRLVASVMASVAAWELDVISSPTKERLQAARDAGRPISGPAVIDDPALAMKIRGLRAKGLTLQQIANRCETRTPGPGTPGISRFNQKSRMQGRVAGWWLWAPCASWPVRGDDSYRGPWTASTANPILLIGTRYEPNTPYINAVRAERLLGNAVLLTREGFGHISFHDSSTCIEQAGVAYLVELITPPSGTVCPADR